MHNTLSRLLTALVLSVLVFGHKHADAQRLTTLESPHFRMMYEKKHAQLAGEILQIAESVWPTLAKAYESYDRYERIDILIIDQSDDANGFAIYPWSQVAIFAPHMDWVLRNRQIWLRNVVTHELAHVFTLRRAAWLSPFDYVDFSGRTYHAKDRINFSFSVPWVPLIAPNWYIEGIAQFEAEQNGNDEYDSQRDMLLRDAWLTGTLPDLEFIETFDRSEDWTQGERVYNTGYAFLRYLKDRFGVDKVRQMAFHKPLFNFSASAQAAFGKPMTDLFEDFKKSLNERYADFKDLPVDVLADPEIPGGFQQNLTFSADGKYMAWLGNDETRRFPANWIYWKTLAKGGEVKKSGAPAGTDPAPKPEEKAPEPTPAPGPGPKPEGLAAAANHFTSVPGLHPFRAPNPMQEEGRRYQRIMRSSPHSPSPARVIQRNHNHEVERSDEFGSEGLQFNLAGNRLLTARQDYEYSAFTDLWEYEFLAEHKSEEVRWHRLTWEERAGYPSYHPEKDLIVFVRKKAGSTNLAVLDSTGRVAQLTHFSGGQQVYNPRFNPKGDSIYFTLQIEEKEAIAVISADAPGFDPFLALKDSAAFPDSVNLAKGQRLTFLSPLKAGSIRHIRFAGDTLVWSSNMQDTGASVYNVYARLPGDSAVVRLTSSRTQALEPLLHGGKLYYQGFQRQKFLLFQRPVAPAPTGSRLTPFVDTLTSAKPKKVDYTKAFESGEYGGPRIAHEIIPFLSLTPQFLSDNRSYTDLAMGLAFNFGDPLGNWTQSFTAAVAKRLDFRKPVTYQLSYSGMLSGTPIRHTRLTWPMQMQYSLYHDVIQNDVLIRESDYFFVGTDSIAVKARTNISSVATRDFVNAYMPLPYNFGLEGAYFRQKLSQDLDQQVTFTNGATGAEAFPAQRLVNSSLINDATQLRYYQTGLGWGRSWMKAGTWLPTGAGLWGSARKTWSIYESGFQIADSIVAQTLAQKGKVSPTYVLTASQFNPWSVDGGVGAVYSVGRAATFHANAMAGAYLNTFPLVQGVVDISGADTTVRGEYPGSLWMLPYQLGYAYMPGYPYNFRYRGRDIMEGSSFGMVRAGVDVPIRGFGFFIPDLPLTSFQQLTLSGMVNSGTTLFLPADRIYDALEAGQHNLLVDYGVRLAANFRIFHQFPFTIYAQGFQPWNNLKADRLFWYDYPHTGAPNADGSISAAQLANAAKDRKEYIKLVKEPRYFVGFTLGY